MINWEEFDRDLATVINKHGIDNAVNIPDYQFAKYIREQVEWIVKIYTPLVKAGLPTI